MMIRSAALLAVFIALLLLAALPPGSSPVVQAQDSETAALIWHMNVYRMQNGLPPFHTDAGLNSTAQAQAQHNADTCGVGYFEPMTGTYSRWNEAGGDADTRWLDWSNDGAISSRILDPKYNSVGVGRATRSSGGCNYTVIWSAIVAKINGASGDPPPTATGGAQVTPTPIVITPSPTPSKTPSPSPTNSPHATTPAASVTGTAGPTPTPTVTPIPTPTASVATTSLSPTGAASPTPGATTPQSTQTERPSVNGDANCDGSVGQSDAMLVLFLAADFSAFTPCLGAHGVDCTGLVDQFDVLALFRYLGGMDPGIPPSCPPLGVPVTPTPTAVPTPTAAPTPTATATGTPQVTPVPTATAVPTAAAGTLAHCFLALASYDVTFPAALSGAADCTTGGGTDYDCSFPDGNSFACDSSSPAMRDRDCYVYQDQWAYCDAVPAGTDYQCTNTSGVSQCFPIGDDASPAYDCVAEEGTDVSCLTEATDFPDFNCALAAQHFACSVIE